MRQTYLVLALVTTMMLSACAPAATPAPTSAPAAAESVALTVAGAVEKPQTFTLAALKGMTVVKIKAEHPKNGMQDYEGVRLSVLLDLVKPASSASKLTFSSGDGYSADADLADVRQCPDCLLAFSAGKLDAVMPCLRSGLWARDVIKIQIQ
jgi:hypothetical protein